MAGSSSAKWEQELKKLSGDIEDVLRNMPESARTRAVEDLTSVLNDLRQKLPGAGGVEGEETTDDEGGGNGDEDQQAGPAGAPAQPAATAQPAAASTLAYGEENEQDAHTQVGSHHAGPVLLSDRRAQCAHDLRETGEPSLTGQACERGCSGARLCCCWRRQRAQASRIRPANHGVFRRGGGGG